MCMYHLLHFNPLFNIFMRFNRIDLKFLCICLYDLHVKVLIRSLLKKIHVIDFLSVSVGQWSV